jgi:hypothetical protein
MDNEQIVRKAYEVAEKVDIKGWVESFTADGTFTDNSIGVTYRGPDGPTGLKIQSFNCYPSGTVIFAQLGVLSNIEAAVAHS